MVSTLEQIHVPNGTGHVTSKRHLLASITLCNVLCKTFRNSVIRSSSLISFLKVKIGEISVIFVNQIIVFFLEVNLSYNVPLHCITYILNVARNSLT